MDHKAAIMVSAESEWHSLLTLVKGGMKTSPFGPVISWSYQHDSPEVPIFFTGWGKIRAAAATQYIIDSFNPTVLLSIGTCGGISGTVTSGDLVYATKTTVYDVIERIGDPELALASYSVNLDVSLVPDNIKTRLSPVHLISADQDLDPNSVDFLSKKFGAKVADWESGAIAYVANINKVPCLILKGVSDIIHASGGEVYGDPDSFKQRAGEIIRELIAIAREILLSQ